MTTNHDIVTPYGSTMALGMAMERRIQRAMDDEGDDLNLMQSVIAAREDLRRVKAEGGPTKILNVVAADGRVREALRAIIAERLVEVAG